GFFARTTRLGAIRRGHHTSESAFDPERTLQLVPLIAKNGRGVRARDRRTRDLAQAGGVYSALRDSNREKSRRPIDSAPSSERAWCQSPRHWRGDRPVARYARPPSRRLSTLV